MHVRSRFRFALLAALAVHTVVALWASHARHGAADRNAAAPLGATQVELEVEAPAMDPVDTPVASMTGPRETAERLGLRNHDLSTTAGRVVGAPGGDSISPAASSEPAADGTWAFSPTTTGPASSPSPLAGRALGSAIAAGVDATVAEDTRKRADFARKHVIPVFTEHDLELGLVPGGALVTLTRDLVRRSRAPINGHAVLQFNTDGAGIVASVRVLDASSSRAEWNEVAADLAAASRSKPMRVPTGASGISVTLDVTSQLKTVNGGTPNTSALQKALGAINDPAGTLMDSKTPAQRVVAARIVDVQAF